MKKLLSAIVLSLAVLTTSAYADILSWNIAVEREDGTALQASEISGHRVYFSDGVPGVYPNEIWVPMPSTTSVVPNATYDRHAVVTTVDMDGRESTSYSVMSVIDKIDLAPPKAPTGITVIKAPSATGTSPSTSY